MPVAVRNPRDTDARVAVRVWGVPDGYLVYLPYRWVQLGPRDEQRMDLLIVPTAELKQLRTIMERVRKQGEGRVDPAARVRVRGEIGRGYSQEGRRHRRARVVVLPDRRDRRPGRAKTARRREADHQGQGRQQDRKEIRVQGAVSPRTSGQDLRVDLRGSDGSRGSIIVTTGLRGTFEARFVIDELERPKKEGPARACPVRGASPHLQRLRARPNLIERGPDRLEALDRVPRLRSTSRHLTARSVGPHRRWPRSLIRDEPADEGGDQPRVGLMGRSGRGRGASGSALRGWRPLPVRSLR